jgi:hypothetical protein
MIRKWKQADNKKADRLDQLIREADRFSEINPTHTDSGARIDFDKETGRYAAESMPEAVRHDSSCCSVGLSLAAFILWIFLWTEVVTQYDAQKPSINEFTTESIGGNDGNGGAVAQHPIPDTALTIVLPNMNESETLKYVWPQFVWGEIRDGFSNRGGNFTDPLEPDVGFAACGLDGGYQKDSSGQDSGSARWPVFCVRAADVETAVAKARANVTQTERPFFDISTQLSGRFGDPRYTFLSMKLMRCGQGRLTPGLNRLYDEQGGECATPSELDELGQNVAWQYAFNIWFRFKHENWAVEKSSESAYEMGLKNQRGPLASTNTNP